MGDGWNTLVPLPMLAMPAGSPRLSALFRLHGVRMVTMMVVATTQMVVPVMAEALLVIQVAAEALLATQVTAEAHLIVQGLTTIDKPWSDQG